ncbi:Replication protein A1 [Operophtera brumata]|uniref:Replication protein A1 n=1 Tax=Operophtera brumata TaxID=104452 RepID=A0A0L7L7B2_OPEBR|nr:Replication protein A1 [Operophtera brumata]
MTKSAIRSWSNAKGEGKLFSMDLCDESGEIRATAFRNECEKFYDMIQVDKVYYISRGQLKTANKQFSNLKNDYEMTFGSETVVAECTEDASSVPTIKYDFVAINEIGNKTPDSLLDVIGVCKGAADVQELTARSTGKLLKKREVTLVDSSGGAGSRLTEFNGSKSLSCLSSSMVRLNPDLPEAHKLRGWYDNGGADMELVNISANLLGVLTFMFVDNAVYKACPQEQCNKKLF